MFSYFAAISALGTQRRKQWEPDMVPYMTLPVEGTIDSTAEISETTIKAFRKLYLGSNPTTRLENKEC